MSRIAQRKRSAEHLKKGGRTGTPLPAVLDVQLVKDAEMWLFLPAVKEGQPQRVTVKLPLKVR